jgi:hypothetical protein
MSECSRAYPPEWVHIQAMRQPGDSNRVSDGLGLAAPEFRHAEPRDMWVLAGHARFSQVIVYV